MYRDRKQMNNTGIVANTNAGGEDIVPWALGLGPWAESREDLVLD